MREQQIAILQPHHVTHPADEVSQTGKQIRPILVESVMQMRAFSNGSPVAGWAFALEVASTHSKPNKVVYFMAKLLPS
jgi:hypothetical protein